MIQGRGDRWRVVVNLSRDPFTHRRRQLSASAATRDEAVVLEARFAAQAARMRGASTGATLAQVVEEWWASGPRLAPTTRANYADNLDLPGNYRLVVDGSKVFRREAT